MMKGSSNRVVPPGETIGDELGEHRAELKMTRCQLVECGGLNEERPDGRIGDDGCTAGFARDERHLAHEITAGEAADAAIVAIRAAKQLLNESDLVSVRDGLANEFRASGALMGTPNQTEAVVAKLGKREPEFSDPT